MIRQIAKISQWGLWLGLLFHVEPDTQGASKPEQLFKLDICNSYNQRSDH